MKKFLPTSIKFSASQTKSNPSGFTLIELLVVIAIIAILSVIAIALFTNVQQDARDGKRLAELEGIANALEVNKTAAGYQPLFSTHFGGGVFPGGTASAQDPQGYYYCISGTANAATPGVTSFGTTASPACSASNYGSISGTQPVANSAQYKICTLLENRGTKTSFCRTNVQ